jgi:ABC-type uncharacterized transport system ATPase component
MARDILLSRGAFSILCAQLKLVLSTSIHCKILIADDHLEALDHSMSSAVFVVLAELW